MRRLTWSDLHGQRCKKKIKSVPWAQVNNAFDRMTYLLLLIYHTWCEYLHDEEPIVQIEDFNSVFIDLNTSYKQKVRHQKCQEMRKIESL